MVKTKSELGRNVETPAEMTGDAPILDINGEPIDPVWAAEFRGFFWGEGTIRVQAGRPLAEKMPHVKWVGYSHSIAASIGLRSDDEPLLLEFQRRLGGNVRRERYRDASDKTISRWVVGVAIDNLRIARLLASPTGLPFLKAQQLAIWRQAVETKLRSGATPAARYTVEDRAFMVWAAGELMRLRRWGG